VPGNGRPTHHQNAAGVALDGSCKSSLALSKRHVSGPGSIECSDALDLARSIAFEYCVEKL
jgi:hypothetical protein